MLEPLNINQEVLGLLNLAILRHKHKEYHGWAQAKMSLIHQPEEKRIKIQHQVEADVPSSNHKE